MTFAFCILVIDTSKQFQLQTGVILKMPDVVTFDVYIRGAIDKFAELLYY